jgi:hypothetical protein
MRSKRSRTAAATQLAPSARSALPPLLPHPIHQLQKLVRIGQCHLASLRRPTNSNLDGPLPENAPVTAKHLRWGGSADSWAHAGFRHMVASAPALRSGMLGNFPVALQPQLAHHWPAEPLDLLSEVAVVEEARVEKAEAL